ncbi:glycoside hydrolase family 3 protein [Francisella frigiditurris]|uniref:beta-N-acetylhexosaminidase n=1 Tax=Francisella frigiditurris TaxID=1542390 RepID=A0A1J0KWB6_9GAMM|nr:glycoside hydrolase family 3 protein [Francisella frigiditurris]APC97955.1 hypothetical protein KX01_1141 [Francisella frigiditurris]
MPNSIRNKIGQLIMMDFRYWGHDDSNKPLPFKQANEKVCNLFEKYNLGGFILFRENIESNEQVISLLRDLQNSSNIPILFGVDQEGGRVNRLKQGTSTCGNMALGATANPENAKILSKLIGDELYSLGINLNFAPVVDINSNPKNPIIGVRAYSDNPEMVTEMARASIEGYKEANIIPCLKHFPGHGNTALDTHLGLVTIDADLKALEDVELYPYINLCKDNEDVVMTAHISVPALDETKFKSVNGEAFLPASLSYKITTELLREKLKFKGLIVTDAMDMKAISSSLNPVEAVKKTILAGTDIAVMPVRVWSEDDISKIENLFIALENEYHSDSNFAKRVDESFDRIIKFKKEKKLNSNPLFTLSKEDQINLANNIVGSNHHKKVELEIAKKATTIVKNSSLLPYSFRENMNVLIIDSDNARLEAFSRLLNKLAIDNDCHINISTKNLNENLEQIIKEADLVLIVSESLKESNSIYSNINKLSKGKSVNIAALTPYDINYIDNVENYVCIYGATSMDQTNYTKTNLEINILAGLITIFAKPSGKLINEAVGKLPVSL